jgi:DNA-binding SARP family transcriptional activator
MKFLTLGTVDLDGPSTRDVEAVLSQPKRLGVLAYLAAARPFGFHRRDTLLAIFWPELGHEPARRALRQAVHFLRRRLGADVIVGRGAEDLALSPEHVLCDVHAFDAALKAVDFEEALSHYRGDLLTGFHVSGVSPRFDQWLDRERAYLRERALFAAWNLADMEEKRGNAIGAAQWARRAADLHATNEHSIQRLIDLLGRHGDRAGAMRAYENFARRINHEYNVEPARETTARMQAVRGNPR